MANGTRPPAVLKIPSGRDVDQDSPPRGCRFAAFTWNVGRLALIPQPGSAVEIPALGRCRLRDVHGREEGRDRRRGADVFVLRRVAT